MNMSIRKYLLVHLLLALTITTLMTVVGNYYLGQKEIQAHAQSVHPAPVIDYSFISDIVGDHLNQHEKSTNALWIKLVVDDLYIMLLTFPLSGFLIWFIIGRGLSSLSRVTVEVSNRAPSHLEPVALADVPDEIRPLIQELNHLFVRLKEGFEREKRFAADAAHELKTPLAAIKAQAQVAIHATNIQTKDEALKKLIASVDRSTHTVQQLLTMSALVPKAYEKACAESVDLTKILREILATFAGSALDQDIDLTLKAPESSVMIKGNATALSTLYRNLIDNAIRYSPDHTEITVSIEPYETYILVKISDQGPGIPDVLRERVFERFFRVLGNRATGTGLGLSIVRQICEMHHARIELDKPHEGTGLIVKLYFPRVLRAN